MLRNPSDIFPSDNSAFCVIHQKDGAFIAQLMPSRNSSGKQQSRDPQSRRVVIAKDVVAGIIHNDKSLLCLEVPRLFRSNWRLSSYKVNTTRSNTWELAEERHVHGRLSHDIETSAGICIQDSGELLELVLYSTRKEILRYELPKCWS